MTKKVKIISIISVIIIAVIIVINYVLLTVSQEYSKSEFVVPEKVSLILQKDFNKVGGLPVLELRVFGGGGCDEISDLKIQKTLRQENNLLEVEIQGYSLKKYKGTDACIAMVKEAKAVIDIADLLEKDGKSQLIFYLGGKENTYSLSHDLYAIYLEPKNAVNVISHELANNIPENTKTIVLLTKTDKLFKLSLYGTSYLDTDYNVKLVEFARSKGFSPTDEILRGFVNNRRDELYVIAPSFLISNEEPVILGTIKTKSAQGFEHIVQIKIEEANLTFGTYSY